MMIRSVTGVEISGAATSTVVSCIYGQRTTVTDGGVPMFAFPDDAAYETVGGYIMSVLGRIPVIGDRVDTGAGLLVVERMDGRRVDRLRFEPATAAAGEGSL